MFDVIAFCLLQSCTLNQEISDHVLFAQPMTSRHQPPQHATYPVIQMNTGKGPCTRELLNHMERQSTVGCTMTEPIFIFL